MAAPRRGEHDEHDEQHEAEQDWPAPDARLVMPGTRYECLDGRLLKVPPAKEPHAQRHTDLDYLLRAHAASGYRVAADLLTRTAETSDFASDVCIYPAERDPQTEGRQLEELAFEIRSEQSMSEPTRKAQLMTRRGVRRVFCVDLKRAQVLEWSAADDDWVALAPEGRIEDPCLVRHLDVVALLDTTRADAAVVAALRARKVPELEAALEEREQQGQQQGSQSRLLRLVERRLQRAPTATEHATIARLLERAQDDALEDALLERDADGLAAWLAERA